MPRGLRAEGLGCQKIGLRKMSAEVPTWNVATAFLKLLSSNATGWSVLRWSSVPMAEASSMEEKGAATHWEYA